jgi:hypothetical protein
MPENPSHTSSDPLQAAVDANDSQAITDFLTGAEPAEAVHAV